LVFDVSIESDAQSKPVFAKVRRGVLLLAGGGAQKWNVFPDKEEVIFVDGHWGGVYEYLLL
jgi:hypothetical protein